MRRCNDGYDDEYIYTGRPDLWFFFLTAVSALRDSLPLASIARFFKKKKNNPEVGASGKFQGTGSA